MNHSSKKALGGGYWKHKIIRVLIPYFLVCILSVTFDLLTGTTVIIPYYWYLDFIFLWYVVFYAVIKIPNLYDHRYLVLGIVSISVFIIGCVLNNGLRAEQAISFLLGVWLSDNYEKIKSKVTSTYVIAAFLILSIALLSCKQIPTVRMLEDSVVWQGIQLVMKVSAAISIIALIYRIKVMFINGTIYFVGSISYELYLVHFQILGLLNNGIIGIIAFATISLLGSWTIFKLTEKIRKIIIQG